MQFDTRSSGRRGKRPLRVVHGFVVVYVLASAYADAHLHQQYPHYRVHVDAESVVSSGVHCNLGRPAMRCLYACGCSVQIERTWLCHPGSNVHGIDDTPMHWSCVDFKQRLIELNGSYALVT